MSAIQVQLSAGVSELLLLLVVLYCHCLIPAIRGLEILLTFITSGFRGVYWHRECHENIKIPYSQLFQNVLNYVGSAINRTSHDFIFAFYFYGIALHMCIHICVGEKQLKMTTHFTIESMIRG